MVQHVIEARRELRGVAGLLEDGKEVREGRPGLGHVRVADGHQLHGPLCGVRGEERAVALADEEGGLTRRVRYEGELACDDLPADHPE